VTGKVILVGAGPGDPGLITVKGLRALRAADVVVYDRLAAPELLDEAQQDAERIDAGKEPTQHRLSQDSINDLMIAKAQAGQTVVRLKGGDPFIFGRGGEEALACFAAGVPFEIVPGVSSAHAAPAYAGIPLTYRGLSSAFTVFTGHEDPAKSESSIHYRALVESGSTLVLLMGVAHLAQITAALIDAGMNPLTPAACIEWGTTPQQRVIDSALADVPDLARAANIEAPTVVVIGEVVALRRRGLDWFAKDAR
jgi:uroporphyrin-III C-methyltransferase